MFIKDFAYDGQGPDAYFYAGESGEPSSKGYLIANEKVNNEKKTDDFAVRGLRLVTKTMSKSIISLLIGIQGHSYSV